MDENLESLLRSSASAADFVAAGGTLSAPAVGEQGVEKRAHRQRAALIIVSTKLAYTLDEFAEAVSLSKAQIRKHIDANDLVPSYSGTKPIISREEGERWLRSLPTEPGHSWA